MMTTDFLNSYSPNIPDDCDMPLFQNSMDIELGPFKIKMNFINSMMELNYLKPDVGGIRFTDPGIEYMMRCHKEFVDIVNSMPANDVPAELQQLRQQTAVTKDTVDRFNRQNTLIQLNDGYSVDYNKIRFKKEEDPNEPMD